MQTFIAHILIEDDVSSKVFFHKVLVFQKEDIDAATLHAAEIIKQQEIDERYSASLVIECHVALLASQNMEIVLNRTENSDTHRSFHSYGEYILL